MKTIHGDLGLQALSVTLDRVSVRFNAFTAVDDFCLAIRAGEIVALLGPSGCGKTTVLKAVSGLQPVDAGRILFGAEDVAQRPPHTRGVGMVFQNYALFPHMTATENVGFGLMMQRMAPAARARLVGEALDLLQIADLAHKYPSQMSGGQQQRVALARTLVVRPKVLLLDEPLSALDRQLRDSMRFELRRLLKDVGITCLIVTHDQDEALTLADRVAVMRAGRIEQLGDPREIYDAPRNRFVAGFIGKSNYLKGTVTAITNGSARVRLDAMNEISARTLRNVTLGEQVEVAVRPEAFAIAPLQDAEPIDAQLVGETFGGGVTEWHFRLPGGESFTAMGTDNARPEGPVTPYLRPGRAVILAET